jgi:carbon-monoxide dehydrogenase large subunit
MFEGDGGRNRVSYSGESLKRFEDPKLLTGRGSFVDDIQLPDMLYAHVLRSPHAHARIRSVDVSAARSLPGVATVLTGEDMAGLLRGVPVEAIPEGQVAVLEMNPPEQPVLAQGKVCYVGQPVAIVVAHERHLARDAAEFVKVDYEVLPPVLDPFEAITEGATPIHRDIGTNTGMRIYHEGGDVEAAFAQADHVVRQRYEVQRLAPAPMENRGVLAHYQPQEDLLTVWDTTQIPHVVRDYLAQLLDRPESSVRVVAPDMGGGFGQRSSVYPEEIALSYISLTLGRPVKWVEDRQENLLSFQARGHTADLEAAVKADGSILGVRVRIVADLGAYFLLSTAAVPLLAAHRMAGPYRTPAMRIDVLGVLTNKTPTGAYRGAGGPEAAFCMERTVDLIAQDLDMDPSEVRRKNFIPPDAFPYDAPTGVTYDSGDYERGLDRVLELSEYSGWREKARRRRSNESSDESNEPLIGVGLSTVLKGAGAFGEWSFDTARVEIGRQGEITVYTGVSPHGQGTETSFAQVAAAELGVAPSDVEVLHSDTSITPSGGGTAASRGTVIGASALYVVLQEAREKLARIASHMLECPAEDVVFQSGQVFNGGKPEQTLSFSQVASAAHNEELLPPEVEVGLDFSGGYRLPSNTYSFGAHVAVVEVDRDTGEVKLVKYVAVHDCGRIINPMLVEGQMHGGIAQGVGQALTEGMVYSPEGQPVTGSLLDYAMPAAEEFPSLVVDAIETPSPLNPLGTKGVGELPTVAAPVAVANAVMHALSGLGIRHIDTPLTPEKVWRALQEKQG